MSFDGIVKQNRIQPGSLAVKPKKAGVFQPRMHPQAASQPPRIRSTTTVPRIQKNSVVPGKKPAADIAEFYGGAQLPSRKILERLAPDQKFSLPKKQIHSASGVSDSLRGKVGAVIFAIRSSRHYRAAAAATAIFIVLAFAGGLWYGHNTGVTLAEYEFDSSSPSPLYYYAPAVGEAVPTSVPISLSNQLLFNTPLKVLELYLGEKELTSEEVIELRKDKLRAYLKERKSPFITDVDTVARQKHWKLILAISFAESTMGKKCRYNNCSGIGGYEPNFRKYESVGDWMEDFNNLLENRYSDWTLEQMNGVYVQPKNDNWLFATRKILSELQERGIE